MFFGTIYTEPFESDIYKFGDKVKVIIIKD